MVKKLVLVFVFLLFLVGCDLTTTEDELDYSDFPSITLTDPDTQLTQPYDVYYLYFYGPTCSACLSIKTEVLLKLTLLHNDHIFLVETDSLEDINEAIAVSNIPTLVKIVDGEVDWYFVGTTQVLEEINTLS